MISFNLKNLQAQSERQRYNNFKSAYKEVFNFYNNQIENEGISDETKDYIISEANKILLELCFVYLLKSLVFITAKSILNFILLSNILTIIVKETKLGIIILL